MPRRLTVTRAIVPPEHESAYLGALDELARQAEARGGHCWVFRDPAGRGTYLEFREWGSDAPAPSGAETRLEARIRAWAPAGPEAGTVWEEVPRAGSRSGTPARS